MKSKKTKQEAASPRGKVKIKNLKLTKEPVKNLSEQDAGAVKGGAYTHFCGNGSVK